jgi:hypothetical protein
MENRYPALPCSLLRPRRNRPRRSRATEQGHKLAPFHCLPMQVEAQVRFEVRPSKQERAASEMGASAAMCAAKILSRWDAAWRESIAELESAWKGPAR